MGAWMRLMDRRMRRRVERAKRASLDREIDARVKAFLNEDPGTQVRRLVRQTENGWWE